MVTNNSENTYITPTANNEVTMPSQPCFSAFNSATDTDVTGDGTNYTVICDTVLFDQNSDYNNGTGTFTSPVTGCYWLFNSIYVVGGTAINGANHYINTSNRTWRSDGQTIGSTFSTAPYAVIADMDAADTATISIVCVDGASNKIDDVFGAATPFTWFGGNLES